MPALSQPVLHRKVESTGHHIQGAALLKISCGCSEEFREYWAGNIQFAFGAGGGRTAVSLEVDVQGLLFPGPYCSQTGTPFHISQVHHFSPFQIG